MRKISIGQLSFDPIPNSQNQNYNQFMADSKKNYQGDIGNEKVNYISLPTIKIKLNTVTDLHSWSTSPEFPIK